LVVGRPSNFSWLVPESIAGSGYPGSHRSLRWLKAKGIGTILSLTDESIDTGYAEKIGFKVHRLPMVNMMAANPEALDHAVDLMVESGDKKVLVHCLAGMGRTGMVMAAYLMREKGMSADKALEEVKRLRPGSLRRRVQNKAMHEYEAYLLKVRSAKAPA
jgi:atypical dual specificity phosphatase